MAAILGLTRPEVATICEEVKGKGEVVIANLNSPQQTGISGDKEALGATIQNTSIGHAFVTFDSGRKMVTIDSIGTRKKFRCKGAARKIVGYIASGAWHKGYKVRMFVASYLIEDAEDPWNIKEWLWKAGFKAVGFAPHTCRRYNREYSVYIFEKI